LLTLHTTASSPTEPFAAFRVSCSGAASYKTALLRSARRHCARGLVAPLTRPALAVHFNCRQPRHNVSEIDQLLNPAPPHSAAYPAPCALVSPPPHAARFIPPRARSGVRWCACLHALLQCFLLARSSRTSCCERRLARNHRNNQQAGNFCFMNVLNASCPVRRSRSRKAR
jgi:hypothetical protein